LVHSELSRVNSPPFSRESPSAAAHPAVGVTNRLLFFLYLTVFFVRVPTLYPPMYTLLFSLPIPGYTLLPLVVYFLERRTPVFFLATKRIDVSPPFGSEGPEPPFSAFVLTIPLPLGRGVDEKSNSNFTILFFSPPLSSLLEAQIRTSSGVAISPFSPFFQTFARLQRTPSFGLCFFMRRHRHSLLHFPPCARRSVIPLLPDRSLLSFFGFPHHARD